MLQPSRFRARLLEAGKTTGGGRRWLASGLTVHKQIMNTIKHKVTRLVKKAKTKCLQYKSGSL